MDDANQKMEALKKAYADIIFHTTKEAAAKIMVTERRAYQYQKEMFEAKEEALNMLVRFKTMMDYKVAEMETTSSNQRRKIGELEAQVQKADAVANELRAELKEVKEELEKMKTNRVQPLDTRITKRSTSSDEDASHKIQPITSESILLYPWDSEPGPLLSSNTNNARIGNVSIKTKRRNNSLKKYYAGSPDLSSITRSIKKPHLYRSGCTQRIHAFQRNQLNGNSSPLVQTGSHSSHKKKTTSNKGVLNKNRTMLGELLQKSNSWDNGRDVNFFEVPCGKRGARSRKARIALCNNQIMKAPAEGKLFGGEIDPCPDNTITKSSEDPSKETEETDNKASGSPLSRMSFSNTINMDAKLESEVDFQNDAKVIRKEGIQNAANGDKVLMNESNLTKQEYQDADNLEVPDLLLNLKKVQMASMNSDCKNNENCELSNETSTQTIEDKFLKFTFRRKRKRTSVLPDKSTSINNTLEEGPAEMQSDVPEPPSSSLTMESSRDDRRLMLVARQLISLKDKKHWQ